MLSDRTRPRPDHQGRLQAVDLRPESEQGRVGDTQDLCGEGGIAGNERDQFPDLDVVARQQIQQSQHDRRNAGILASSPFRSALFGSPEIGSALVKSGKNRRNPQLRIVEGDRGRVRVCERGYAEYRRARAVRDRQAWAAYEAFERRKSAMAQASARREALAARVAQAPAEYAAVRIIMPARRPKLPAPRVSCANGLRTNIASRSPGRRPPSTAYRSSGWRAPAISCWSRNACRDPTACARCSGISASTCAAADAWSFGAPTDRARRLC